MLTRGTAPFLFVFFTYVIDFDVKIQWSFPFNSRRLVLAATVYKMYTSDKSHIFSANYYFKSQVIVNMKKVNETYID